MNNNSIQPTITTWTLGNFQAIRERQTLDLKPLTIFSGPNSSGKSAVIKSILMVAQSLSSSARDMPLVLNGKYTQLGGFDDIIHHQSNPPQLRLGFVINGQEGEIEVKTRIKKDAESPSSMRVEYSIVDMDTETFKLNLGSPFELGIAEKTSPIVKEQIERGLFDYKITAPKDIESRPEYEEARSASLLNFLPGQTLVQVKSKIRDVTAEIEQVIAAIRTKSDEDETLLIHVDWDRKLSEIATSEFFNKILGDLPKRDDDARKTLGEIVQWQEATIDEVAGRIVGGLEPWQTDKLVRQMNEELQKLKGSMNTQHPQPTDLDVREFPSPYNQIIQQIRRVFERQIFYLGPLRDDPRTIYAIPSIPSQRDVGLKGEYTAAMLNEHKELDVRYPRPPLAKFTGTYDIRDDKLGLAVQTWLKRMGLAKDMDAKMISKVGYQLAITPEGVKQPLDLTSLGVGVSQVLPIIVMSLIAPEESVLIFEQPEVHLHPKVQSVLGDFFLGIVGCGKQCIVETHSEYLIHRIRRRIAESSNEAIRKQLGIYFVELKDGVSQFSAVETNKYGAILDWPNDFFDETEKESEEIIIAAVAKQNKAV